MMTVKRHLQSIASAPRAHGIAMAWHVGIGCGLQSKSAMPLASQSDFSPVDAGVVKTL